MGGNLQTAADEFVTLFKRHLNGKIKATMRWVVCEGVNWDEKTMDCVGMGDDLQYYDVALGFGSIDTKPAVNSDCLIAILEGDDSVAFLIYAVEAELIQYNNGENGGLIINSKLKTEIEKTNNSVSQLKNAVSAAMTTLNAIVPGISAAFETASSGMQYADLSEVTNDKVKH
ncbi:MAG: hypothetical protein VB066_01760 [Paludibacter sp.]|nr:hypothetical protein [Paludibacter sp.]